MKYAGPILYKPIDIGAKILESQIYLLRALYPESIVFVGTFSCLTINPSNAETTFVKSKRMQDS